VRTLVCTAAAAALLLGAPVALAHQGNPNYRSVVRSITPGVQGVEVSVLNYDDRLLLHNTSGRDVVILDYKRQPYARVLADGTVSVNTNSEAYYLNEDRQGETAVPANLPAEPNWKELSRSARFEWHDHRAHWMGEGDPPQLEDKDVRTKLYDWEVPIEVGGQAGAIAGDLTWVPTEQSSLPLGAILAFAGLIIVLSLAVFVIRRRRAAGKPKEVAEAW
jgi:hypothetical protein